MNDSLGTSPTLVEVSLLTEEEKNVTSFLPTDEEREFIEVAKGFALEKIRPIAREVEVNRIVNDKMVKELEELGFLSREMPEEWEGLELPLISQAQILQALSYGDLAVIQGLPGAGDAASFIRLQKDHPILSLHKEELIQSNKTIALLDLLEVANSQITIEKTENGWMIDGVSQPIRLASFADYVIVAAKDNEGVPVVLWVDIYQDQVKVDSGDYRLGLLASGTGKIIFDQVQISKQLALAEAEDAVKLMADTRNRIRVLQAAKQVGLMEAALDYATEYTAGRKAFGQEIAKFQGVSFRIADMAMETRIAAHLVWEAALAVDGGKNTAAGSSIRALYRAHRSLRFVTDSAVQLLGGHGYVQEYPVEKWMRDAQAQVTLYGRERELLIERGEQILSGAIGVTV